MSEGEAAEPLETNVEHVEGDVNVGSDSTEPEDDSTEPEDDDLDDDGEDE